MTKDVPALKPCVAYPIDTHVLSAPSLVPRLAPYLFNPGMLKRSGAWDEAISIGDGDVVAG